MAAMTFPYSYYRCSCPSSVPLAAAEQPDAEDDEGEEEEPFDPSNSRSNFSLYPLDNLLWCGDCHDIRCPRCTVDEVVCWYCPNCLFEVPSSTIKSDGNRCTRNCFNCPECYAQLQTMSTDPDPTSAHGPYILNCSFCNWTSLDVNLKFDSPRHILEQLQKNRPHKQGGSSSSRRIASHTGAAPSRLETVPEPDSQHGSLSSATNGHSAPRDVSPNTADARKPQDAATRFANLKAFYKDQLGKAAPLGESLRSPGAEADYSPGNLQRIMNLYSSTTAGTSAFSRKAQEKPKPMREVSDVSEGFSLFSADADAALVRKLRDTGFDGTTSVTQRAAQQGAINDCSDPRFLTDLRPIPTLLCTKRSARCGICRHILMKPEPKVTTTRYRIKLIATDKVPTLSLKPLIPASSSSSVQPAAAAVTAAAGGSPSKTAAAVNMSTISLTALPAHKTLQFLLKITNPMFDPVHVSLATPPTIPSSNGRGPSRITILCPEFDVGANSDIWDDALLAGTEKYDKAGGGKMAVAGRVWERGRNWTTVVVEIVPEKPQGDAGTWEEDADVLEIPIFVRAGYEAEAGGEEVREARKEKRTLSYWAVLGVGKIALE